MVLERGVASCSFDCVPLAVRYATLSALLICDELELQEADKGLVQLGKLSCLLV
jgi:hypothetical protein